VSSVTKDLSLLQSQHALLASAHAVALSSLRSTLEQQLAAALAEALAQQAEALAAQRHTLQVKLRREAESSLMAERLAWTGERGRLVEELRLWREADEAAQHAGGAGLLLAKRDAGAPAAPLSATEAAPATPREQAEKAAADAVEVGCTTPESAQSEQRVRKVPPPVPLAKPAASGGSARVSAKATDPPLHSQPQLQPQPDSIPTEDRKRQIPHKYSLSLSVCLFVGLSLSVSL
jgi:hypothetical protein